MITKVACENTECSEYNVTKPVASAMLMGLNPNVCPQCGGRMAPVERIKSSKGGSKIVGRNPAPRYRIGRKRVAKRSRKRLHKR